ncbi:MAG TPA: ketopantoate reductase family protein, partial [Anaerolineae bacterium]|nr:ketopantoate reductase family protein [Anaerolineae bacterium]
LAGRPRSAEAARAQGGVRLAEADGRDEVIPLPVHPSIHDALAADEFDLIILAVKAYHTETAAREIREAGGEGVALLSMQNGVGNEEALGVILPASPILAGVITTPVEVRGPVHVKVSRPSFHVGLANAREKLPGNKGKLAGVAALLRDSGFAVTTYDDYRSMKWSKLLMNILANAQSAILGYTPAQIFADPRLGNLELRAWREALAVMRGQGVKPVAVGGYPLPLAAKGVQGLPLGLMRPIFARFIVGGRGEKMPSLYYDLHPQPRAHSEIDWLHGAVAREGARLGIPTPVNATFTRIMRALLRGEESVDAWAGQPERLLAAVVQHGVDGDMP